LFIQKEIEEFGLASSVKEYALFLYFQIYSVRVRTGPYADVHFSDFTLQISTEVLQQLVLDLKTVGYSPLHQLQAPIASSATPSPVPSLNSQNNSLGGSVASDLDILSSSAPGSVTPPSWNIHRKFWQVRVLEICSLFTSSSPSAYCLLSIYYSGC
jgi:hypothetical protein